MTVKLVKIIAVLLFSASLGGCGTYVARVKNIGVANVDYFKGTVEDYKLLGFQGSAGYGTVFCYATIICPFAVLLSIPFDLVVDTLLLPYDHVRANRHEHMTYNQAMSRVKHGTIKYDFGDSNRISGETKIVDYQIMYSHAQRSQFIFLDVDRAPLVDGVAVFYIPYFSGYTPYSLSVHDGRSNYPDADIYIKDNAIYKSKRYGSIDSATRFYESGMTLVVSENFEVEPGEISITPSLDNVELP
jgi:uncharacterized protein YceK